MRISIERYRLLLLKSSHGGHRGRRDGETVVSVLYFLLIYGIIKITMDKESDEWKKHFPKERIKWEKNTQ